MCKQPVDNEKDSSLSVKVSCVDTGITNTIKLEMHTTGITNFQFEMAYVYYFHQFV